MGQEMAEYMFLMATSICEKKLNLGKGKDA
jgi:hypothetical protein